VADRHDLDLAVLPLGLGERDVPDSVLEVWPGVWHSSLLLAGLGDTAGHVTSNTRMPLRARLLGRCIFGVGYFQPN